MPETYANIDSFGFVSNVVISPLAPEDSIEAPDVPLQDLFEMGYYFENNQWSFVGQRPANHVLDKTLRLWVPDIQGAKQRKTDEITSRRIQEDQRFEHAGKWFQGDAAAWKHIMAVHGWVSAQGTLPPGFPSAWKAEDNSYLPINTVNDWWQLYGSVLLRGAANFQRSETLKAQVTAAVTQEDIEQIAW